MFSQPIRQQLLPTPSYILPLMFLILPLGLTCRSRIVRVSYCCSMIAISFFTIVHTTSGTPATDYLHANTLLSSVFQAVDCMWITDTYTELRLVGQQKSMADETFFQRLLWSLKLVMTPRCIGWTHEPRNALPPHPESQSRLSFIFRQLRSAVLFALIADIFNIILRSHPASHSGGPSFTDCGPLMRLLTVCIFAVPSVSSLSLMYTLFSVVCTAVGLYKPEDWPAYFGYWSDAYTIRRLWGRTWHQIMRRFVSSPGKFISNHIFHLAPGTNASSYTQLFVAFLISGFLHQCGDYALYHLNFWKGRSLAFFLSQACVITFEDGVIALGKRLGMKGGRRMRIVGYIWTYTWFAVCLPMWIDPMYQGGFAGEDSLSLVAGAWKGDWTGRSTSIPLPLDY